MCLAAFHIIACAYGLGTAAVIKVQKIRFVKEIEVTFLYMVTS